MYLMIDNYDSFVYNLVSYLQELGQEIMLVRNDQVSEKWLSKQIDKGILRGIIISPGPKSPDDCGACLDVVKQFAGKVPILGVCLGYQIILKAFDGVIEKGKRPMHGKLSMIRTNQKGLFEHLPSEYQVTRYHSLKAKEEAFPKVLRIDARSEDGVIMALHHKEFPIYGIQFHPEAVLTQYGHELLRNFITMSERWWNNHGSDCKRVDTISGC